MSLQSQTPRNDAQIVADLMRRMEQLERRVRTGTQPQEIIVGEYQAPRGRESIDGRQPGAHNSSNVTGAAQVWDASWTMFHFPAIPGWNREYRMTYSGNYNHVSGTITDNNFRIETAGGARALTDPPYTLTATGPTLTGGTHKLKPANNFNADGVFTHVGPWTDIEGSLTNETWTHYIQQIGNNVGGVFNAFIYNMIVRGRYVRV